MYIQYGGYVYGLIDEGMGFYELYRDDDDKQRFITMIYAENDADAKEKAIEYLKKNGSIKSTFFQKLRDIKLFNK